jgi:transposase-like protein
MFIGHCFPKVIILQAVYFKLRFTLSYRDIEELLRIRGVIVDHATIWWFWLQILFHNVGKFVVF